jgi:hypothetical protein
MINSLAARKEGIILSAIKELIIYHVLIINQTLALLILSKRLQLLEFLREMIKSQEVLVIKKEDLKKKPL